MRKGSWRFLLLVVAGVVLLGVGTAVAQVEPAEEKIIYSKSQQIIFKEVKFTSTIVGPVNSFMRVKKGVEFDLLIPVRGNFLPEIMQTAGSL